MQVPHKTTDLIDFEILTYKGLTLIPGGFTYRGCDGTTREYELTGQPITMLRALFGAYMKRVTANKLRRLFGFDDEKDIMPEDAIKDAAKKLRAALRIALKEGGFIVDNPVPSIDRGRNLAYKLVLPDR
jgi:hypothetical protein